VIATIPWGPGANALGRLPANESSPEAPMSISVDGHGKLWILDQVQRRVVQLDGDRTGRSLPLALRAAEDLAITDSLLLVLDRLVDAAVVALDPADGKERWRLPVKAPGIPHGGGISGVFAHDGGVWLEWDNARSWRAGSLVGVPATLALGVPGRPSRDGRLGLAAVGAGTTKVRLVGHELSASAASAPTWLAEASFDNPVLTILALDSDMQGRVWLAVTTARQPSQRQRAQGQPAQGQPAQGQPAQGQRVDNQLVDLAASVLRFGADGRLQLRDEATLERGPEEQMRTFAAGPDGSFWHLARGPEGATIERWSP